MIPAARYGDPAEIAGLAVFLSGEAAGFVNGQVIAVDGGLTAAGLGVTTAQAAAGIRRVRVEAEDTNSGGKP
jgi:uncharacterized Zn-binding protein involved in type VI secretion